VNAHGLRTLTGALALAALAWLAPGAAAQDAGSLDPAAPQRVSLTAPRPLPGQPVLRERALRFVPLADGREAVLEGTSNRLVHMIPADKNQQSFLRVTIRILQVTRQHRNVDTRLPFLLVLRAEDGLVLEDPLTHSSLPVRAFGSSALASVAPLLTAPASDIGALPTLCSRLEC
jgi:hypothetical protein